MPTPTGRDAPPNTKDATAPPGPGTELGNRQVLAKPPSALPNPPTSASGEAPPAPPALGAVVKEKPEAAPVLPPSSSFAAAVPPRRSPKPPLPHVPGQESGKPRPARRYPIMSELTKELMELVWGAKSSPGLSDTIFCRWTQGFVFSESEGSALEQFEGGPCAVIAPVQAFLLKKLLFSSEKSSWRDCQEGERKELLCHTLCAILESACCSDSGPYCLASWLRGKTAEEAAGLPGSPAQSSCQVDHSSALAVEELGFERFHALIQKRSFRSLSELKDAVFDQYSVWGNKFGVLLFLYSVLLTKGIENIKNEIEDSSEPLIDPVYGHGSQSLINLLLTGHAVSNVWDGDRECSGMSKKTEAQRNLVICPVSNGRHTQLLTTAKACAQSPVAHSPPGPLFLCERACGKVEFVEFSYELDR
ncbi:hypothetical protein J1605_005023 [Eschrichtius robustus]|uniref:Ubiquitin carboxyl-terminal hydrolase MINDY n=1 Tax=Eschrichtius robustus TaxID=9764 RepID=A0AB34HBE7_ESCRO|nr:hypothetical protein J1605_005023 [Eschrichtius robustus]